MSVKRVRDLADVLRAAGVPVVEEKFTKGTFAGKSWQNVAYQGRDFADMRHIMWHHDASGKGPSAGVDDWIMYGFEGSVAANAWVCLGCNGEHEVGAWHLFASGQVWHAGKGGPGWGIAQDAMNSYAFGIEVDHTSGESWKPKAKQQQLAMLRKGTAAMCDAYGLDPEPALLFHRTWTDGGVDGVPTLPTKGRKTDIDGLTLNKERAAVKALLAPPAPAPAPEPAPKPEPVKPKVRLNYVQPGCRNSDVRIVKEALKREGLFRGLNSTGYFGDGMRDAYSAWQRRLGYVGQEANGTPGIKSLTALGAKYGFEVSPR